MITDPTRIDIDTDPTTRRMRGVAYHGNTPFDVPYISEIAPNLWQGGCASGLILPTFIKHVVSLYPWERYEIRHEVDSELYVKMYDSVDQGFDQVCEIAAWVNERRLEGPALIHCQAGLNRSSLVTARALYIHPDNEVPDNPWYIGPGVDIIARLRDARSPAVLCNPAFEAEVRSWT